MNPSVVRLISPGILLSVMILDVSNAEIVVVYLTVG